MAEMKISNTLVNDTKDGVIAYALQLKDTSLDRFLSDINLELLTNIDLKDYNTTTNKYLPKSAKDCTFEYDGEAVYVVPTLRGNTNCMLVYAHIYKSTEIVDKLYLVCNKLILNIWEGNEKPDWTLNYLPDDIANTLITMSEKVERHDYCLTWAEEN